MENALNKKKEATIFSFSPVQLIAFGAIFMALRVVLGFLEINIGDSYRFTFSPIPVTLAAYMLGPVWGGVIGGCGDIITLIIHPTGGINFGILFAKIMWGVLMGLFLHKKHIGWGRAIIANLVTIIVCNVVITTASLCKAYGYPVEAILPVRLVTNAVHFVVYSAATFLFATVIDNAYKRLNVRYAK